MATKTMSESTVNIEWSADDIAKINASLERLRGKRRDPFDFWGRDLRDLSKPFSDDIPIRKNSRKKPLYDETTKSSPFK